VSLRGARGYLLKGALKAEILRAIRAVATGEAIFGPVIAKRLINYFAAPRPSAPVDAFPELTEREKRFSPSSRSTKPTPKSPGAST
jgi:DNA-binding NarL/FixJ family response regulator